MIFLYEPLIFATQNSIMTHHPEYHEELQKVQGQDFTHNWVSSSGFLFYLQIACIVAFLFGTCTMLYNKKYSKIDVPVQESSQYTPKYK